MAKISDIEGLGLADARRVAEAGVTTAGRSPKAEMQLMRQVPSVDQVADRVAQAGQLSRLVNA